MELIRDSAWAIGVICAIAFVVVMAIACALRNRHGKW